MLPINMLLLTGACKFMACYTGFTDKLNIWQFASVLASF